MVDFFICHDRKRILEATGHVLVTGDPGSGKTTIALRKAVERIEAGLEPGQKVLFLSFSRAAIARIADSARRDLPCSSSRLLEIQTFHSFCWQLLQGHAYLIGSPRCLEIMLPHDERIHRSGAKDDDTAWQSEKERLFIEEGKIVFDLFAPKAFCLLSRSAEIRHLIASCFPLIIVDEAQDTGNAQWECIRQLCDLVQLVFLADESQQIYDFRPDVSAERVTDIMKALKPVVVKLGSQNKRSPGVEIVEFGNDILSGKLRGHRYEGIHYCPLLPHRKEDRNNVIRQSVSIIDRLIKNRTGDSPKNIALLTNWGKGVAVIARALQGDGGDKYIRHRVVMDETEVLLAARVVAQLIEPVTDEWNTLASTLELLSMLFRAKGPQKKAEQLARNARNAGDRVLKGRAYAPRKLKALIDELKEGGLTGNPGADWLKVRNCLDATEVHELKQVAQLVVYLMAFNRGRRIADSLSDAWLRTRSYQGARSLIEAAIKQDQLAGSDSELGGVNVMTIHKSKGKEFDGVVIFDMGKDISPLCPQREKYPYYKSRKLFRVGVTRARHDVLILTHSHPPCVLLNGHYLN